MNLADYDYIVINTSAGKDSQAMLDVVVALATAAGVRDRLVAVHADLGRVEWDGTRELAEEQARHYGVRFEVVRREAGDLLDQVEARGMWPSSQQRYCTSDQKRDQVAKLFTRLTREGVVASNRKVRILDCQGIRAQESTDRAKKQPFARNGRASNGRKTVDTWYPIFDWTLDQVWARNAAAGTRHHPAYDLGMSRLSCVFCVFASKKDLAIAAAANPQLLDTYAAVEQRIGHTFRLDLSIAALRDQIRQAA